ncbi:MAG: HD domain-containing phosphohydrolase [Cyanobacteriota bacterium]
MRVRLPRFRGARRELPDHSRYRPSVAVALVALYLPLVMGTGLLVGWFGSQRSAQLLASARQETLEALVGDLRSQWASRIDARLPEAGLDLLVELAGNQSRQQWLATLPLMQQLLERTPTLKAYYLARADGSLFRVVRVRESDGRVLAGIPATAALLVEGIEGDPADGRYWLELFDQQLRSLGPATSPQLQIYDPRQRPWYRLAQEGGGRSVLSPVHHLQLSGGLGVTLSRRLANGQGAVGASLLMDRLEPELAQLRLTPNTQLALVDRQGRLLLAPGNPRDEESLAPLALARNPELAAMAPLLASLQAEPDPFSLPPSFKTFEVGGERWAGAAVGMSSGIEGMGNVLLVAVPERELLAGADHLLWEAQLATLLVVLLAAPLVWLLARWLSRALRQLARQAAAIRRFDFTPVEPVPAPLQEVHDLTYTLDGMRRTIRSFLQSSTALGAEPDVEQLLERLLDDAIASSGARAGVLYRTETTAPGCGAALHPVQARGISLDGLTPLPGGESCGMAGTGSTAPDPTTLRLPLRSRDGVCQGLLELRFLEPPEPSRVAFCTALSGSAAVALETRSLIAAQKQLFEAFVQLIADAIDAKSPHTGGHCARVPELAKALAGAACDATTGPYAPFQLNAQEWEALHIAAWLHDCGKVTTPEYVVDKATKLETLYDRIHEVRMRFELLKAAAESRYWQGRAEGDDPERLRAELEASWAELDDDFAFVAACNIGSEALDPAAAHRLERIAQRRWRRTLDDRLGLAAEERQRAESEPEQTLPVLEPLLADRPRHRIHRAPQQRRPAANPLHFTLPEPALLANRGELHNLTIRSGTLNPEERYVINEHIIQTIRMLEALPFPPHLQAVPEIAGGHHEHMDGRGYPRGLRAGEMSPLARMMALADVFEALTAADRPYKSGKTLSEALQIMAAMVRRQHLDPELFELFVRAGVYCTYAERFLHPAQCDGVDEAALLAAARPDVAVET